MGERKFVQTVQVTWPRWLPRPYMVKTLKNHLLWNLKLVCSIGCSSTTKFIQTMTLSWPWHILRQGQVWSLMLLYGKKVKQWNYCSIRFEISNRWPKWQEVSVDIKTLSPGGCMPPALGLYTCIKSWIFFFIKSDFQEISLKFATNG